MLPRNYIRIEDEYYTYNSNNKLWVFVDLGINKRISNIRNVTDIIRNNDVLLFNNDYVFIRKGNQSYIRSPNKDYLCIHSLTNISYIKDKNYNIQLNTKLLSHLEKYYKDTDKLYGLFYDILFQERTNFSYFLLDKSTYIILCYAFRGLYDIYYVEDNEIKKSIIPHGGGRFQVLILSNKEESNILINSIEKSPETKKKITILHKKKENIPISLDVDKYQIILAEGNISLELSDIGSIIISLLINITKI